MHVLTSTVDTVCALELRAIADCGSETDDRRLVLLGLGGNNGVVNALEIAISPSVQILKEIKGH